MSSQARPQEHNFSTDGPTIRFDRYQVDVRSGELRKEGRKVRLQAQPFQLLLLLLRNAGRVVSREDVKAELWPGDTFVDFDHGLAAAVNKIREALCDSADKPKFIETLPRRGYRFIGKIEPDPPVEIRPRLEEVLASDVKQEAAAEALQEDQARVRRARRWALGAALVLLGTSAAAAIVLLLVQKQQAGQVVETWTQTQFTSYAGVTQAPVFSPDGSRIAFGWDPTYRGKVDLFVKALGGEASLQLTHHPSSWISADWSPDGTQIAFMRIEGPDTGLYIVPALGGPEQKLLATTTPYDLAAPISWSPDGKWIAYSNQIDKQAGDRAFVFSMETRESHLFYHDPACMHEGNLVFSNSGNRVAWICVEKLDKIDVMVGDPAGKTRRLLRTVSLVPAGGLSWSPDDSTLIMAQQGSEYSELYEIKLSDSSMRRAPAAAGQTHANWPSVSAKTGAVAWTTWRYRVNLVRIDLQSPKKTVEPLLQSSRDENIAAYSPDGKHVAFKSDRSGEWAMWIGDADGSNLTQISKDGDPSAPKWSPESRRILYGKSDGEKSEVFLVDVEERVPRKVRIASQDSGSPFWSHDGRWIYFQDEGSFQRKYWRCSLDCNRNETLVRDGPKAGVMQESDDGNYWYYASEEDPSGEVRVARESWKNGRLAADETLAEIPSLVDPWGFSVTKDGIYFVPAANTKALWYFDFASRKTKQIVELPRILNWGIWASRDGRTAVLPQWYDYHQDIMLAEPKR